MRACDVDHRIDGLGRGREHPPQDQAEQQAGDHADPQHLPPQVGDRAVDPGERRGDHDRGAVPEVAGDRGYRWTPLVPAVVNGWLSCRRKVARVGSTGSERWEPAGMGTE